MKAVTIRQIAQLAGTSTASVSRCLNGLPGVSSMTRSRIEETVRKLNYNIWLGKPFRIALILPSLQIPRLGIYSTELLNVFRQLILKKGGQTLIVSREDCSLLREYGVSGAISFDFQGKIGREFPVLKNLPLVCINDCGNPLEDVAAVYTSERFGIRRAMELLTENNHRRIGCLLISNDEQTVSKSLREHAFREETASPDWGANPIFLKTSQPVIEAVSSLLAKKCTALIVSGEGYEGPVLHSLAVLGKRIPEDISVITYETPESCFRSPRQTTIGQDFMSIAKAALDLLEKMIRNEPHPQRIEIPVRFTVRESVRNLLTAQN